MKPRCSTGWLLLLCLRLLLSASIRASLHALWTFIGGEGMDRRLLDAAVSGSASEITQLASEDPALLFGTTPQGNTCLHIASIYGHEEFCKDALALSQQGPLLLLLGATNKHGETPLLTAVTRGHASLASFLLGCCHDRQLSEVILKQDKRGCNALHHAIRRGYRTLALELLEAEPALSKAVNERDESPMFIAVMRNYIDIFDKLLEIPDSAHSGACGFNVLHAAVRNGNSVIAKRVMETRPWLVTEENKSKKTPMSMAVSEDKIKVLTVLLELNRSLGYQISTDGIPLLCIAATQGHIGVARELLKYCPDAPYCNTKGSTCLHVAVSCYKAEFVKFVLSSQQLQNLINMADSSGETALHLAKRVEKISASEKKVEMTRASEEEVEMITTASEVEVEKITSSEDEVEMITASKEISTDLVRHQDIDRTMLNNAGNQAVWVEDVDEYSTSSSEGASAMDSRLLEAATTGDALTMFNNAGNQAVWVEDVDEDSTSSSEGASAMDDSHLLDAATTGDTGTMKHLSLHQPAVLLETTPQGNTCLHIASIHGHERFCKDVLALNPSLLASINSDGETPLLTAATSGRVSLASVLLSYSSGSCDLDQKLSEAILKQDNRGSNVLHHANRSGQRELALKLIDAEPALSKAVNKYEESPMYMAVMRNYADVSEKLLRIPDSAHGGTNGMNALHAAVRNGNSDIAKKIMETRPGLAREEEEENNSTPIHLAALWDKTAVLTVLLEHDRSLGYLVSTDDGTPLLTSAAYRGHVGVARVLLKHCPDAPYCYANGWTCLHTAVKYGQTEFVEFILGSPQLRKLVNMQDADGETALHLAVRNCNPKMVAALLLHQDTDVTVLNRAGDPATWGLSGATDHAKTLNWNEVSMLMSKADPQDKGSIYNLHREVEDKVLNSSKKDIKSLTQTYTGNTSLVAILLATITFAAAFTSPGGYSTDAGSEGLPIMAKKVAFQAFLISDTLAMCTSLSVAFICVIAKWEDLEFLLYYRSFTKKLMWFAYVATTTAFATGLYTVLAPRLLWLAVTICVLTTLLPILTKLLGEWPILKLRFRLGRKFKSELLDMV